MQHYLAVLTIIIMMGLVIIRVATLKKMGIVAMQFGKLDKNDLLLPPVFLIYFYLILASAFEFQLPRRSVFFHSDLIARLGVPLCFAGFLLFGWNIISFGKSFRVGIDVDHPDELITTRAFAISRNPIYVGFAFILTGQFLIFPNSIPLIYLCAGIFLFHRQTRREEGFLINHDGKEYLDYCQKVRRYL